MSDDRKGWGWPDSSKKAHYFNKDLTSLCGKWLFMGALYDNNHGSSDNCADCKRRLAKLEAK